MENLVLITGNDPLAIKDKTESIIDTLKEKIVDEYSFETVAGGTENSNPMKVLEELSIAINTPSFFGSTKTVWVKHFSHFELATGKDKKNKIFQDTFREVIETIQTEFLDNNNLALIIDGPELDRRTFIYKFFAKNGKIHHLSKINTNDKNYKPELRNKIRNLCELENVKINYDAVEFLVDTVGSDTGRLTGEIAKLISYIGTKRKISLDDCQSICSKSLEMANWVFAEALANKNIKSSFNALNIIIDKMISERSASSKPELSMLFGAIRKFQDLIKIKSGAELLTIPSNCQYPFFKSYLDNAKTNSDIVENDNILLSYHPYRAFKLYEQAQKFSDNEIADIFSVLLEANKELVSGNNTQRIVLENLVLKVCAY
jgi:DNA polymerase III subunit delta